MESTNRISFSKSKSKVENFLSDESASSALQIQMAEQGVAGICLLPPEVQNTRWLNRPRSSSIAP